MKVLNIKENKDGSVKVLCALSDKEYGLFKSVAKKRHKRFNKYFIRKEILKAMKRYNNREVL